MAQKKLYCYAVLFGGQQHGNGQMFVQARNAERARDYTRRWLRKNNPDVPHERIEAVRWETQIPKEARVHNETDIPWYED